MINGMGCIRLGSQSNSENPEKFLDFLHLEFF